MTDRIQELAEQAGLKYYNWSTNESNIVDGNFRYPRLEDYKKFGQLIVRECMNICAEREEDIRTRIKDEGKAATAYMIRAYIKEHFGVEE